MKTYDELGVKVSKMFDDLALIVSSNLVSRINSMKLSGMSTAETRKVLVADLITGGRIFGQFRNGVKRISKNAIEEAGNIASIKTFEKAGLKFYNDIVLRNAYGTAMLRANNTMKHKKVVKVHQNVLVFVKGDPKKAAK